MEIFDVFATFGILDNISGPLGGIRQGFAQTEAAGGRLSTAMGSLTKSILPFVAAAGIFLATLAPAVGTAANFEAAIAGVGSVSSASVVEMQKLEQAALDLGASTAWSASEVASAEKSLAMAGFEVQENISALPGVLDLASAAQFDLGETANIASNILSSFGMEANQMGKVADILTTTFTTSNTTLASLSSTMANAGSVAAAAGASLADVAAMAGKLGDVGIDASVAGTGIKIMFQRLQAPTGEAAKALDSFGIATKDAAGNMLPIFDILGDLETAMNGMGTADRAALLKKIFGDEAISSVTSLMKQGIGTVKAYAATLEVPGAASEVAAKQLDNLNGAVTILGSAWEGLQITIGSIFLPVLTPLVRGITGVVNIFNFLAGHPLGKALLAVSAAIAGVVVVAGLFSAAMWGASIAVGALNLSLLANPFVLAGAAIVGVIVLVNELLQDVKGFASLGEMWTEVVNAFNNIGWRTGLQLLWDSLSDGFKGFLGLLATVAISALAIFVSPFAAVVAVIGGLIAGVVAVIAWNFDSISDFFTGLGSSILSGLSAVVDGVKFMFMNFTPMGLLIKHFDEIVNYLSSIDLTECGRKLWTTFTDGLKSKISAPVEIVKSGLQAIRNMLPFSDAKTGPLSTLTLSGQRMMETLATGVGAGAGALIDTVAGALAAPAKLIDAGIGMLPSIDDIGAGISSGLTAVGNFLFGVEPELAVAGGAPAPEVKPITTKQASTTSTSTKRNAPKSGGMRIENLNLTLPNVTNAESFVRELQKLVEKYDG